MQGKIVKGIAGFYYVQTVESGIYECKARGIFRKDRQKPLVGDLVDIEILSEEEKTGNLVNIRTRKNQLIRPAVANVDQAVVIFAIRQPDPNFALLDRFLVMMSCQQVPVTICFNKCDLADEKKRRELEEIYCASQSPVIFTSTVTGEGLAGFQKLLHHKTTVVAGPSGVGKSSLTNQLQGEISMETGEISRKLKRGKHTTRHSQLIALGEDSWLMDTPGFTSLYLEEMKKEDLRAYYPEFYPYEGACRFQGCVHVKEPGCRVKDAVEQGRIHRMRYESYVSLYEEVKEQERRKY